MKILVIPDVHGTHEWEKAKELINEVDKVVFLGDYVDSWDNKWPDQGENLNHIFKFAREHKDKVDVLIGNHDWSYVSESRYGYQVSGHQIYDGKSSIIHAILMNGWDLLKVAVQYDGYTFAHAGFTHTWKQIFENEMKIRNCPLSSDDFIEQVNEALSKHYVDEIFDWYGTFSGSGDEVTQGPLWVRPNSLLQEQEFPMQVAGHTEVVEGVDFFAKGKKGNIMILDSPSHNNLKIIDTKAEYVFKTPLELAKEQKHKIKEINDKKSVEGSKKWKD